MTSRLTPLPVDKLTPEQQEAHARIARFREPKADGQFGGPFDPWVRSPELARRMVSFGNFIWERTTLDRRVVELAICVTARFWRSNVEWVAHSRTAKRFGVSEETLDDVMNLRAPTKAPADELVAVDVSRAIHETHELPKELYDRAVAQFGEQGLAELIATIGYYTTVSMTLNAFDIPVAEGEETPFPR